MGGHIYRRALRGSTRHRWYAVVDVAPLGQPRKQLTRAFDTRREAQAWVDQTAAGRHTRTTGPTVGEYLAEWLAGRVALRPSTLASYRAHIERHLLPQQSPGVAGAVAFLGCRQAQEPHPLVDEAEHLVHRRDIAGHGPGPIPILQLLQPR